MRRRDRDDPLEQLERQFRRRKFCDRARLVLNLLPAAVGALFVCSVIAPDIAADNPVPSVVAIALTWVFAFSHAWLVAWTPYKRRRTEAQR